jgi:hypothetical protein
MAMMLSMMYVKHILEPTAIMNSHLIVKIFRSEWGFGVWWGLSPLIPTKTLVPNKA